MRNVPDSALMQILEAMGEAARNVLLRVIQIGKMEADLASRDHFTIDKDTMNVALASIRGADITGILIDEGSENEGRDSITLWEEAKDDEAEEDVSKT